MRKINCFIIHCTATRAGREVSAAEIDGWHRARGFNGIGYHYLIHLDGRIEGCRPVEQAGAHCLGHNLNSIGIAYVGGLDNEGKPTDTRTPEQRSALRGLISVLHSNFPRASVWGHCDFAPAKQCPCFNARAEFGE